VIDSSIDTSPAAWIAPSAELYGDIRLAEGSSIWPKSVLRVEDTHISVGAFTNLQDFVMVHFGSTGASTIGDYCSITHHTTIHGATIGNCCLIGINVTVMDGAVIGDNCIVAGNSIVREGQQIPANSIVAGVPAKVIGERNNYVENKLNAFAYHENALAYARGYYRRWSDADYTKQMEQRRVEIEQVSVTSGLLICTPAPSMTLTLAPTLW